MLAGLLADRTAPLTPLLEDLAGYEPGTLVFRPARPPAEGVLDDVESARLGVGFLEECWRRTGVLAWPGLDAVRTTLTWLPGRLPSSACWLLQRTEVPFGTLLPRAERTDRRTHADTGDDGPRVTCSAVMTVQGRPAAIAAEVITPAYLRAVATREG
jgi:hypothetical protein